MPVDQYIGGITHAIFHLLYARFYTRALGDLGLAPPETPRAVRAALLSGNDPPRRQGDVEVDGETSSPDEYFATVGADALRLFHLFVGPPVEDIDWGEQTDSIIDGCGRYLRRVWRLAIEDGGGESAAGGGADETAALRRLRHKTVRDVGRDLDSYAFNTAVSSLMELTNQILATRRAGGDAAVVDDAINTLLLLLAPLAPHLAAEAWEQRNSTHVHEQQWPAFDNAAIAEAYVEMVVQVDGKVRDRIIVPTDISEDDAAAIALRSPKVLELLGESKPTRVISRPPRLVNIVTGG
jgi:leucyl-tRNA synthetase